MLLPSCADDEDTIGVDRIYGISASGTPVQGEVTIRGAKGKTSDCSIGDDGTFSVDVSSLTPPFLLCAKGTVNNTDVDYYSYASSTGRVNISQLTHAVVSMAIQKNASQYYSDFPEGNLPESSDIYGYANYINVLLSDSYTEIGLEEDFDFLHDAFSANNEGFDLLLDRILLTISASDTIVFLSDLDTHIPIFSHDMNKAENIYFLNPERVAELLVSQHCYPFFQNLAMAIILHDFYLWNKYMPEFNAEDYADPERLLDDVRYDKDRWSVIVPKNIFDSYMKDSAYVGLGFYMGRDVYSNLRISFVYPYSPADLQGLTRGDIILEINGKSADQITSQNDSAFGDDLVGEKVYVKVERRTGSTATFLLTKQELTISSVLYSTIFDRLNDTIGYLVFNNFVDAAIDDLEPVFKNFKENNISELILDLRYNSGGLMLIAQHLASLIGGKKVLNETFCKIQFNEDNTSLNRSYQFVNVENSVDIERLIVITTGASCSASEVLINGLKPYMDVIVIGSPTCGKPVGMNPFSVCDKYILPITNEVVNVLGEGQYYEGINVDCVAYDDLSKPFGNADEDSLREALYYIDNQHCSYGKRQRAESHPFPLHGFRQEIGAF
jgi:C-terminal processing protease CtpA/Prc